MTNARACRDPGGGGRCALRPGAGLAGVQERATERARIAADVEYNSMDLLQAAHTWSGVEMALWDLLGRARGEPVWRLLGYGASHRKVPYASVLFGDTPHETLQRAPLLIGEVFHIHVHILGGRTFSWPPG